MQFSKLIEQPASWMLSSDQDRDIVLTSRIRLARNIQGMPFPGWAKRQQRDEIFKRSMEAAAKLKMLKNGYLAEMSELDQTQRQILVERHLVSRELAARSEGCGVAISSNKSLSILLNEEDHLRIQYILPGQQLKKAWASINKIDDELEAMLPYAYHEHFGYLTSCPTNTGTGMRASSMLHLPGLVMSGYMQQVEKAAHALGLTIRGIYGESTQGLGNLFQISNQTTTGESESDIISKLSRFINDTVKQEENARQSLFLTNWPAMADRISRSYGILQHALMMTSKEALDHISMLRLYYAHFRNEPAVLTDLNKLTLSLQSAHMQYAQPGEKTSHTANDFKRADLIRQGLKTIPQPSFAREIKNITTI